MKVKQKQLSKYRFCGSKANCHIQKHTQNIAILLLRPIRWRINGISHHVEVTGIRMQSRSYRNQHEMKEITRNEHGREKRRKKKKNQKEVFLDFFAADLNCTAVSQMKLQFRLNIAIRYNACALSCVGKGAKEIPTTKKRKRDTHTHTNERKNKREIGFLCVQPISLLLDSFSICIWEYTPFQLHQDTNQPNILRVLCLSLFSTRLI